MTNITRRSLHLSLAALGACAAMPGASFAQGARQMPKIKLVILDMGGTLIQDHGEVPTALTSALSRHTWTRKRS
jgi:hypothetical protein